uniref:CSC1/OSCA1-like 7TM region domain-containing protein n=1 Tax=Ditylum brightwellii TaxID=49249 RepID=A0A7S4UK91_9STRA
MSWWKQRPKILIVSYLLLQSTKADTDGDEAGIDSWELILPPLYIYLCIGIVLNLVFEFGRRSAYFSEIYDRKREWRSHRTPPPLIKQRRLGGKIWTLCAPLEWLFLGWDERYEKYADFMDKETKKKGKGKDEVKEENEKKETNGIAAAQSKIAEDDPTKAVTSSQPHHGGSKSNSENDEETGRVNASMQKSHGSSIQQKPGQEDEGILPDSFSPEKLGVDVYPESHEEKQEEKVESELSTPATEAFVANPEEKKEEAGEEAKEEISKDIDLSIQTPSEAMSTDDSNKKNKNTIKKTSKAAEQKEMEEVPEIPKRRFYLSTRPGYSKFPDMAKHFFMEVFMGRGEGDEDEDESNTKSLNKSATAAYKHLMPKQCSNSNQNEDDHRANHKCSPLPPLEAKLLKYAGLDSYLMIRFVRFGFDCTFYPFLLAVATLIPIYYTDVAFNNIVDESVATESLNESKTADRIEGYFRFTINRLEPGSLKLWAVWVYGVLFIIVMLIRWYEELRLFELLREDFLIDGDFDSWVEDDEESLKQFRHSCLVESIPPGLRHNDDIYEFYDSIFRGRVKRAEILYDTERLTLLMNQRDQVIAKYENVQARHIYHANKYKRQIGQNQTTFSDRLFALCRKAPKEPSPIQIRIKGEHVDALKYYKSEIERLNREAKSEYESIVESIKNSDSLVNASFRLYKKEMQQKKKDDEETVKGDETSTVRRLNESTWQAWKNRGITQLILAPDEFRGHKYAKSKVTSNVAFVEFTDKLTKQTAIQSNLVGKANWMVTKAAPDPRDIVWNNATLKSSLIQSRKFIVDVILLVGVLFWGFIVAALTNLFNPTTTVANPLPENDTSALFMFIRSFIPVFLLSIILLILPTLIRLVGATVIRFKSGSDIDKFMFHWNIRYRIAQFFTILISGTIFDTLQNAGDDPQGTLNTIVNGILTQSPLFFNIVVGATFFETMLQICQLPRFLFILLIKYVVVEEAVSDSRIEWLKEVQFFRFGRFSPPFYYVLLIALVYSAISPLVLGICAVYFYIATKVYTHQALYVFSQPYEGGGKFMYSFNKLVFIAMYSSIIILAVVLTLKQRADAAASFAVIMILFTFTVQLKIGKEFIEPSKTLPLVNAANVDEHEVRRERHFLPFFPTRIYLSEY